MNEVERKWMNVKENDWLIKKKKLLLRKGSDVNVIRRKT